jgi:integrase
MTSKKAGKDQNKTRKKGVVSVGTDGNMLRLQFPSKVSQAIWKKPQKYKSLGLFNTPENMAKAQQIAFIAQMDLLEDNFDVTLEKYNPFLLEKTVEKIKPESPGVLELCEKHYEVKIKPFVTFGTQYSYQSYLRSMKECSTADISKDAVQIKDSIRKIRSASKTRIILSFIDQTVEWAKRNQLISKSVENPYKDLMQDVVGKNCYQKPKHVQEFSEEKDGRNYKAYSPHEAAAIIEEFGYYGKPKGVYKDFVEFLFLTGCRTGEAIGLRWEDITDDCSEITFCHSFCKFSKEVKPLKTARYGNTSRNFPCGDKLKQLLLRLRNPQVEAPKPKSFVFNRDGNPISYESFQGAWTGEGTKKDTVILSLIKQGKLKTYLKPYSTRHSFITWQLKAGMTPANVALLVGNSPGMIHLHYVSADEDAKVVFEV